jgi:hypothetical protein
MPDARYFRDQAILCLEMARQMSNPQVAENLRASAASHLIKAIELEQTVALVQKPRSPTRDE